MRKESLFVQSSRDNMSVILVAFPSAPKVDPKAKESLDTLKKDIQKRVNGNTMMR